MSLINIVSSVITLILTIFTAILTFAMFRLNKTMTKIAEDDKQERAGHSLNIVLPEQLFDNTQQQWDISNFCISNNKNKVELIFHIYIKIKDKEYTFWRAYKEPIVISPYEIVKIKRNTRSEAVTNFLEAKIYAVTNDATIELDKNIDCYTKPLITKDTAHD